MTLAELLVAAGLTVTVAAGVSTIIGPAQASFAAEQERADLQQRVRVAVETLTRDLRRASDVRPYRIGTVAGDAARGVYFRSDTIGIVVPAAVGADPAERLLRTYYLKTTGDLWQLMQYDGRESTFPVIDDVIALAFDYFGEPQPPDLAPDIDPDDAVVPITYGPPPPPLAVDDPRDAWGFGENCVIAVVNGQQRPRLMSIGGPAVPLPATMLTDGPWCPDSAYRDRFDADLLRIRRVRVRLRLQASTPFRGAANAFFTHNGMAVDARRHVPDQEVRFDVTLRNWNATYDH